MSTKAIVLDHAQYLSQISISCQFCLIAVDGGLESYSHLIKSFQIHLFHHYSFLPPYNIHALQTTQQDEDRGEKKSQPTKKKKSHQKDEKKSHPTGEIKSQPSDEKKPHLSDEQKSHRPDEKKSHPEEETPHPTQHRKTDKGEKADERLEDSAASDSSPDFSDKSAESSRKSSLSESSSRELNEVDLIDGKDRIVSHFEKHIFFRLYSHKSYAPFLSTDL